MSAHRERQPEPGSLEEVLENRYEHRKRELELEKKFQEELLGLLGEERFSRAHRILHSDAIGVKYTEPFIGLLTHATHMPSRKGIRKELRDPSEANELIERIFGELESFIKNPKSKEYLPHRPDGDELKLDAMGQLFKHIHRRVLHDVPIIGLD